MSRSDSFDGAENQQSAAYAGSDETQNDSFSLPDLTGEYYTYVLERFHRVLNPRTYFEIGTQNGQTLALSSCASIAIDPSYQIQDPDLMRRICNKKSLMLFEMTSDAFFHEYDPNLLFRTEIELAFLDGMHRCEFLLRDFMNTERYCRQNSVIFLHDCLPVDLPMTVRDRTKLSPSRTSHLGWWTGDVWRTALFLKRYRSDLAITSLDARETGLIAITNLDPAYPASQWRYAEAIKIMRSYSIKDIGLKPLFDELGVEPTANFATEEQITAKFWL